MTRHLTAVAAGTVFFVTTMFGSAYSQPAPAYTIAKTVTLGAPDRWDYVVFDPVLNRV